MRQMTLIRSLAAAGFALAVFSGTTAHADAELPKQLSMTAYGTTSTGYAQVLAIGNALKDRYDTSIRIIPGKNDMSRMIPLKKGVADYCACSIAAYFAQEGAAIFAVPEWGPQRLFNMFNNGRGNSGFFLVAAGDADIKSYSDIRGKRVGTVVASPAVEYNTTGLLAFGGLTWSDVKRVEFPGFKQMASAIVSGQVDVIFANTTGSYVERLAASPRKLTWLTYPHDDEAGWERFRAKAPYFNKRAISEGVELEKNLTGKVPFDGAGFPYPIYVTYDDKSADQVYALTKAVLESYDSFKDSAPASIGYSLDRQVLSWVLPYHPGSVRYFKEKGLWTDEADSNNQMLLKRQDVLAAAWAEMMSKSVSEDDFRTEWMQVRARHLSEAGMPIVFEE